MKRAVDNLDIGDNNVPVSERRLKAAKKYVDDLYQSNLATTNDDDGRVAHAMVHKKLRQDLLESSGKSKKDVAANFKSATVVRTIRKHKAAVTSCAFSADGRHIVSACKQGQIMKCDVETGNKIANSTLSTSCLCLAMCSDGRYLAAGTNKGELVLMEGDTLRVIKTFPAHRGSLNGLAFRSGTHQLFTGGADKLVKVWEPDHGGFIEVLCGHTDAVTSVSCLVRERPLTSGGQDSSLRIWKLVEESQLVYNMPSVGCCADCCCYVDDSHFLSGSTDGAMSLWVAHNKQPLATVKNPHGENGAASWLSSVSAHPYSDIAASGAADGFVRLWQLKYSSATAGGRRGGKMANADEMLKQICAIPLAGCVNAMQFSSDCSLLAAAVGREHRFGRWTVPKEAKNCVALIRIARE